jgi:hypothetical protein
VLGLSIGTGEPGAGAAERRTRSGAVPSVIVLGGRPVRRVLTVGFTGVLSTGGTIGVVEGVVGVVSPAGGETAGVGCAFAPPEGSCVLAKATPDSAAVTSTSATACPISLLTVNVSPLKT